MRTGADNTIDAPGAIVLGAGIAGLFAALKLAPFPTLLIATGKSGHVEPSAWAQGGIAAAMGAGDSSLAHAQDTIAAAAGTGDERVAALVAREAPQQIDDLIRFGAPFDRDTQGRLALAREAAHSHARIVHVSGDRAGAAIMATLSDAAAARPSITIMRDSSGRTCDDRWPGDQVCCPLRAEQMRARALPCAGDRVRHRWPRLALCSHHQSTGVARRRHGNGGARRRGDRRCGICAIPSTTLFLETTQRRLPPKRCV